ncbi:MAG: glycosyltransferase [Bacteroidales bacterium]|nr:glycosyltransferase [Bacteroidales bacterium]
MKVLQLGKFYPIVGGVEKVMWDLTRGISSRGIDCDMLCCCLPADMPEGREIRFNEHGRCICVKAWRKVAATMISPALVFRLRKISRNYDIIHIHHPDPMAALALWLSGFRGKVVLHWHSDILKQKRLLQLYKPLQSWLLRRADIIVGTSPVYLESSPFLEGFRDKAVCVPIGIEPLEYDREAAEAIRARFPGRKIVFSMGRLVGYKGYGYLVEAASMLPEDHVVVIAGEGPLREELTARIKTLGLEGRVLLPGYLKHAEAAAWFNACDLYVMSSVWKTEAFGIVQIEAMSCGKPVVSTRIPGSGVSWVNAHGVSGLTVGTEDSDALAKAILEITSNNNNFASYSAGARKRYESLFTFEEMIDNAINQYKILISR